MTRKNPVQYGMTPAQLQASTLVQGIIPAHSHTVNPDEWDFKEFLMAMTSLYHTDVSTYDSAEGLDSLVTEFEMSIVTLYDHPHDSDESSSVAMLLVKNVPLLGWKRIGDRSDYSDGLVVFNDAQGRELAMRVWKIVNNNGCIGSDTMNVLDWVFENNHYVHCVKDLCKDPIAYVIDNPRWMLRGQLELKNALYAVNGDKKLARIKRIVSTAVSPDRYGPTAYHRSTVELEDGSQCELESTHIVHTPLRDPI
jgi:hypothetical protein